MATPSNTTHTVTSTLRVDLTARETGAVAAVGESISVLRHVLLDGPTTRSSGTGAGEQDLVWSLSGLLGAATPIVLPLSSLPSILDNQVRAFAALTAVVVRNRSAAGTINLSATAPVLTDPAASIVIEAGGLCLLTAPVDGWPVGAGTDTLTIATPAGQVAYDLLLLGKSQ